MPLVFENSDVRKEYLAIAEGEVAAGSGTIDLPLGPDPTEPRPSSARRVVAPDGAPARTGYEVVERFKGFTLLQLVLFTGRQHQVRVHLRSIGHPVVCDGVYGLRGELRLSDVRPLRTGEEDVILMKRQALHAYRVSFPHPATGRMITVEAPVPEDMRLAMEAMCRT